MSLILNSSDINIQIFDLLNFGELLNLYKTNNKILIIDIEKYTFLKYKKSFKKLYLDNKCLHCNNLCDNVKFKLCDICVYDTCWKCYNKVGSVNLCTRKKHQLKNFQENIFYQIECINKCIFNCRLCHRSYNKNDVIIDNCVIICIGCKTLAHN
jgi:hypothetical protein